MSSDLSDVFKFLNPNEVISMDPDFVLAESEPLVIRQTITYIVVGLIFRKIENGGLEILMIQEARKDCGGTWYLPAGRVEPNGETIEEGMQREVVEETGITCKSLGLLAIEPRSGSSWFRFTFLAAANDGNLKTVPDKESLGAAWYPVETVLNSDIRLRSTDIFPLIQHGVEIFQQSVDKRRLAVPINRAVHHLFCRVCLVHVEGAKKFVLLRKSQTSDDSSAHFHLPLVQFSKKMFLAVCVYKMKELFDDANATVQILASISCECYPNPPSVHDGVCLTVLSESTSKHLSQDAKKMGFVFAEADAHADLSQNINYYWSSGQCKFL